MTIRGRVETLLYLTGLYVLIVAIVEQATGVALWTQALGVDLLLTLGLAIPLLWLSRSRRHFLLLMTLGLALLHGGNAVKIRILGGPLMPDDLFAARSLFLIMTDGQRVMALGGALVLALALGRTISLKARGAGIALLLLLALPVPGIVAPSAVVALLDDHFGNVVWNQRTNYESRGPLVHLVQELARHGSRQKPPPDDTGVRNAVAALRSDVQPAQASALDSMAAGKPRSVVLVVLESFWDPSALSAAGLSDDPLDPRFRALWRQAGDSRALVPVFGGYTANSEFEVLCGFPVAEDTVFFETRLHNDVPCLPRLFSDAGYAATASHPNVPVFWNRVNAYRRIGFDVYRSLADFTLDEMHGEYLSDASLYRQVLETLKPVQESGTPSFTYILTFFGHLDYPLDDALVRVRATSADPLVERYASTVLEKSRSFMDFLEELQARDPEALVVAVGDHLPFLGPNFGGYRESGVLAADRADFDDRMFRDLVATPLLIIDGPRGALPVGTLALYQVPGLIRTLAGLTTSAPMDLLHRAEGSLRPLPGMHFVQHQDDSLTVCRSALVSDRCAEDQAWLDAVGTLSRDLFSGHGYVLSGEGGQGISGG
ncbi:LTA synthase family protein [Pararhodospirillum photometricum]|uniref:LTA synthase family protein n=1 Tax=Pararhodospirillum photometricum TaxID=1084 RepID=UPI0002FE3413|nr:LTA synthase family protein [Pararhodospirillum photometricum]